MKKIFHILIVIMFLVTGYLSLVTKSYAADNFTTSYDVTYTVLETGITHVTMKVKLTNESSQYYASSYKVHVGFEDLDNITVTDPKGKITPDVQKSSEGLAIGVTFNEKVVGKGKTLPFTVEFDTKDIAQRRGSIWSINIPGIADQKDFSDFHVQVVVPPRFGQPIYSKPETPDNSLSFTKDELGTGGVSLAFGEKQAYDFYLTYHLRNKNVFPIRTEVAFPPDTNYQEVVLTSVTPQPVNVTLDQDGNWLAEYQLKPSEEIDVIVKGKSYISLKPKPEPQTEEQLKMYLKPAKYWQTDDPEVKKLAGSLKTPEAIYQYVIKNLTYDFSRVTGSESRLGALAVLKNPNSAVCLEFTDLFITLARAAGIPAREVNGYAYTENDRQRPLSLVKDILHAWPEYYDRKLQTWVMIDPTWGNTTNGIDYFHVLDFDHFAFIRRGIRSDYPIPAGGYKSGIGDEGKDVHVEFGKIEPLPQQMLTMTPLFHEHYVSFLPIQGELQVFNSGKMMSTKEIATITSPSLKPFTRTVPIPPIPPGGMMSIPLSFQSPSFLTNAPETFTIQLAGKRTVQTLSLSPFVLPNWYIIGGLLVGISSIGLLIITLKSGRLPFLRQR